MTTYYNSELRKIIDKHAPEQDEIITMHPTLPWFTQESLNLKRKARKAERHWRANKTKENEYTFKLVQKAYRKHLKFNKYIHINSAIKECGNNLSKMYNLIFGLIGRRKDNPMPKAGNDEALANDFLDYFMGKIEKIWNDLDAFELYDPSSYEKCLEQFSFKSVSEQAVLKVTKTVLTLFSTRVKMSAYANSFIKLATVLDATPQIKSCMTTTNKNTHI